MAQNGYQIVEEVPLEGLPTPGTQEAALYALHTAVTERAVMWSLDPTRDVAAFLNAYAKVLEAINGTGANGATTIINPPPSYSLNLNQ